MFSCMEAMQFAKQNLVAPPFHRPRVRDFFRKISEVFLNLSSFRQRRPRAKFFRNVREVEIRLLSKFQLGTTLGGHKNAEKPKRKKVQTLNGRLPPEDGSVRPENLAKRVSDDSQHLIFRRRTKKIGDDFFIKKLFDAA